MKFNHCQIYHIYNQGNNRQPIFFEAENYRYFLEKVNRYLLPFGDLLCYCLMPNHFHFLFVPNQMAAEPSRAVKPREKFPLRLQGQNYADTSVFIPTYDRQEKLSQALGTMLSSYTKAINRRYHRSGSLFRGKTKAKTGWIDGWITLNSRNRQLFFRPENDYARQCFLYIHQNPVKAGLTRTATEWPYSSAREYEIPNTHGICNQQLAKLALHL